MLHIIRAIGVTGFIYFSILTATAQELRNPFDFPILLSANFGELRANHFHSGLDFKTQGVEGKALHAVKDGFISRISVSPWGYGNALYIDHPDSTTTVYGHMQRFTKSIAQYVKEKQYELESFNIDVRLDTALFAFKEGEIIGYAGNSGSSGGPHLHFEIRDTQTEEVIDPLPYYKDRIKDTKAPAIHGIKIHPIEGLGIVNGSEQSIRLKTTTTKGGELTSNDKIEAWGKIGFSIQTLDRMDNTSNIYGTKTISMSVNGIELFYSDMNRFSFDETRYINSLIDYDEWRNTRKHYVKTFVEPGNRLSFINHINRGYLTIEEEGDYEVLFLVSDLYGNTNSFSFWIEGIEQSLLSPDSTLFTQTFHRLADNTYGAKGIRLHIPRQALYADINFKYSSNEDLSSNQTHHKLHHQFIPLHTPASMALRIVNDSLPNKKQYGVISLNKGRRSWVGGQYKEGWMHTTIRELGYTYTIGCDSTPPKITPINTKQWGHTISFHISDNLSGISSYRGEINGAYALFEMDGKNGKISYQIDKSRLDVGQQELVLHVIDACGNTAEYVYLFTR